MISVLQVVAGLSIGGMEKVARDIALRADPAKFQVDYVVFGDSIGAYESELLAHGCRIFHIASPSKSYINYVRTLKQLIAEHHYDVIHAHSMFNIGWVMLAGKQMKVPVRIAHSHSALDNGHSLVKRVYEVCMRSLILHGATDFIGCGQKAGERLFGKEFFAAHGRLIPNGIDVEAFQYNESKRIHIRTLLELQDNFIIGHTGHLAEVKNQKFLIDLMPQILLKKPNAVLLLLGEGPDRPMLEARVCELGLENNVFLPGNVTNVPDYLSAMDVFAFPSLYEGTPLSIIEVQANGLPCILSTGVPKDVFLTDLIHPLALEKTTDWINDLCCAQRQNPSRYPKALNALGVDISCAMKKFYQIYQECDSQ